MQHTRIILIIKKLQKAQSKTLINYNKSKYHCAHFVAGLNTEVRSIHLPFRGFGEYSTPASHHLLNLCKNSAQVLPFFQAQLFPKAITADFHSAQRDVQQGSYLFGEQVHLDICTEQFILVVQFGICLFEFSEEVVVHRVKGALESLQVVIVLNIRFICPSNRSVLRRRETKFSSLMEWEMPNTSFLIPISISFLRTIFKVVRISSSDLWLNSACKFSSFSESIFWSFNSLSFFEFLFLPVELQLFLHQQMLPADSYAIGYII